MIKKSKSTKQIRAIDRIIKFQMDDGIESLTISGKEALADVSIDSKANVTLYLNADKDKLNEIKSLVPFITVETKEGGKDPEKTKSVELSQDLTQFALEIADNSKKLASLIKTKSSIVLDLDGLVQRLLEIAGNLAELERKNQEQDDRLNEIDVTQEAHAGKLAELDSVNTEQTSKIGLLENNLATVEQNQESQGATLKDHGERITVLESLKPSEGDVITHAKLGKQLMGGYTRFIFDGIALRSIVMLSIQYNLGDVYSIFTRTYSVHSAEDMQAVIGNENVAIYYDGVNTLTVSFNSEALGQAIIDVTVIKEGGFSIMYGYIEEYNAYEAN